MLFNFLHHSSLKIAYLSTRQIPEAHILSSALGTWNIHTGSNSQPVQPSFATYWAGPWQCPRSTAGLVWRSWAQDMAHTMEAAICLSSLPAEPCASATEHEDLPECRKGSLRRSETHFSTLHHLLSFWGHRTLLSPLLCLGQVVQGHHAALARHVSEGRYCEAIKMQNIYIFSTSL